MCSCPHFMQLTGNNKYLQILLNKYQVDLHPYSVLSLSDSEATTTSQVMKSEALNAIYLFPVGSAEESRCVLSWTFLEADEPQ